MSFSPLPLVWPSLCIPFVHGNISHDEILTILEALDLGNIERIDIVAGVARNGKENNKVFVHFYAWYENVNAIETRNRVLAGGQVKVVYDAPWFWMLSASRVARPEHRQRVATTPYLDFGEGRKVGMPPVWHPASAIMPPPVGPPGVSPRFGVGSCPPPEPTPQSLMTHLAEWSNFERVQDNLLQELNQNSVGFSTPTVMHPLSTAIPTADIPNNGDESILQLATALDAYNADGGDSSPTYDDLIHMDAIEDLTADM